MKKRRSEGAIAVKRVPLPRDMLARNRRPGKFQGGGAGITVRQHRRAVEIFSRGAITVMTRKESLLHYGWGVEPTGGEEKSAGKR